MPDKYILRSGAIDAIKRNSGTLYTREAESLLQKAIILLKNAPAADVVEVVHGRWFGGAENFTCGQHNAECSICHCCISWNGCDENFNYCPNCGAKMDGGENDVSG